MLRCGVQGNNLGMRGLDTLPAGVVTTAATDRARACMDFMVCLVCLTALYCLLRSSRPNNDKGMLHRNGSPVLEFNVPTPRPSFEESLIAGVHGAA